MFKIKSYVNSLLLSHVDKYACNFDRNDAQVTLWAGAVTLHNLVLRADVLQKELELPFKLVSGRIHELHIQVPWTKVMSEPIIVTINTIECILSLDSPPDEGCPPQEDSSSMEVVEVPPGYMRALVRKIVSNIAIRVNSLIVKYVQDDVVLSLNVERLSIDNVGANWQPCFADVDHPFIRRLVSIDDLTLCLDKTDSDGKIRNFNQPLLYRCQLSLRVLTRLVSPYVRKACSLDIQLLSSGLDWSVNNEQLVLLLRLLRERSAAHGTTPPQPNANALQPAPSQSSSTTSVEPVSSESWSEWAWSYLPTWIGPQDTRGTRALVKVIPINFTAFFQYITVVYKTMETESSGRRRPRPLFHLTAMNAVIKCTLCSPTLLQVRMGTRNVLLLSKSPCVCGHGTTNDESVETYLDRIPGPNDNAWQWVDEEMREQEVQTAVAADEELVELAEVPENTEQSADESRKGPETQPEANDFWQNMAPVVYLEYTHNRSPPEGVQPFDNPPRDFEYSDWSEDCSLKIAVRPMQVNVTTGLQHRLSVLRSVLKDLPPVAQPELRRRTLTVEECDALTMNLPRVDTSVEVTGLRVRLVPNEHSEKPTNPPLVLDLRIPKATVRSSRPLYPNRVCLAASQLPRDDGPLWHGAQTRTSAHIASINVGICAPKKNVPKFCARAEVTLATQYLANKNYFTFRENIQKTYKVNIHEANICGSLALMQATIEVAKSVVHQKVSQPLRLTTLAEDALKDEKSVAIDVTAEDCTLRNYITKYNNTYFLTLQSIKATAIQKPASGEPRQAWLFSGPESPQHAAPYIKLSFQWCNDPLPSMIEYMNLCVQATGVSLDPMLVAWLGYQPELKKITNESQSQLSSSRAMLSAQDLRRRATPPSSYGRGARRAGPRSEPVHIVRPRSVESDSERSERKDKPTQPTPPAENWFSDDRLRKLFDRLNRLLLTAEIGLTQLYVATTMVSSAECETIRNAMERHAAKGGCVLVLGFGRLFLYCNSKMNYLWEIIEHDRPTLFRPQRDQNVIEDSFPWKMFLSNISCHTIEVKTDISKDNKNISGLKSQLKISELVHPRPVLDWLNTTVTLTMVTKNLQIKHVKKTETQEKQGEHSKEEEKTQYFNTGIDFNPSTLKDFIRGPNRRKTTTEAEEKSVPPPQYETTTTRGPVVSLGLNIHADTPPITMKMDQDQAQTVTVAVHGVSHILKLFKRPSVLAKQGSRSLSRGSFTRSASDMEATRSFSEETTSERPSEQLISIYESQPDTALDTTLKKFFWFQWVVNRATLVVTLPEVKLVAGIDDIMGSVDLHSDHKQFKVKIASSSVKYYERTESEWTPGALDGRILQVCEPTDAKDESNFLSVTVTEAKIANLPDTWKEDLHHLEQNSLEDTMWEINATLAPLEMAVQPNVLENVLNWIQPLKTELYCPLPSSESNPSSWHLPLFYLNAGGLRLLLTRVDEDVSAEDTIMIVVGKVAINPNPQNPICRQTVNINTDAWNASFSVEGRQYEVLVKRLSVRLAKLAQLIMEETASEMSQGTGSENPAHKWSQPVVEPAVTPVLHSVDVSCILAPAAYSGDTLICGPAVELNLLTDCSIELGIQQLDLIQKLIARFTEAITKRSSVCFMEDLRRCSYALFLMKLEELDDSTDADVKSTTSDGLNTTYTDKSVSEDSASHASHIGLSKESVSHIFAEARDKAHNNLELFVTMGVVDLSLYVCNDGTNEIEELKPPPGVYHLPKTDEPRIKVKIEESKDTKAEKEEAKGSVRTHESITETIRKKDIGNPKLDELILPLARKAEGNVPLFHVTLQQPNLYYMKKKSHHTVQICLFDAWVGLGVGQIEGHWNAPLLSTAPGLPDPVTEIPPALATLRVEANSAHFIKLDKAHERGTLQLDIERPIMLDVCCDRLRRVKGIMALIKKNTSSLLHHVDDLPENPNPHPFLYRIRQKMANNRIEYITVLTGQIGVRGSEGAIGLSSLKVQAGTSSRPLRVKWSGLVTGLVVTAGPPTDRRRVVLHPLVAGGIMDATWDAWRRAEVGVPLAQTPPTVLVGFDVDRIILDLRPCDLEALGRIQDAIHKITNEIDKSCENAEPETFDNSDAVYYGSDLQSGVYKIVSGNQFPTPYQVTLNANILSWRYPQPRAIRKLIVYKCPNQEEEVECALELYCPLLCRWEPYIYFKLPVEEEPVELQLSKVSPDALFAEMWRIRAYSDSEQNKADQPFEFNFKRFMPRDDLLAPEKNGASEVTQQGAVTAELLLNNVRVQTYVLARHVPLAKLSVRVAALDLYAHNDLLELPQHSKTLEGYYVSKPLMRSHRVLSVNFRSFETHVLFGRYTKLMLNTNISSDILNSATGSMEPLVKQFRVRGTGSLQHVHRVHLRTGDINVALNVLKMCTLESLTADWRHVHNKVTKKCTRRTSSDDSQKALDGRISLWVHNTCSTALRIGQEDTEELIPLRGGASLAYRWRSPTAPKKLRFAIAGPTADWCWSRGVVFVEGSTRVKLKDGEETTGATFLYVRVKDDGFRRCMHLSGKITLANMLRSHLMYKVLTKHSKESTWKTIHAGDMFDETVAGSVLCDDSHEIAFKLKFASTNGDQSNWSGPIPLKECSHNRMPWLVKLPVQELYKSIWCRVIRARSDGRILATTWPFYTLRSHLTLDVDVTILSSQTYAGSNNDEPTGELPQLESVQQAPGRGGTWHLIAPGTTYTTHALTFKYQKIGSLVTREAVPLHYGVMETSVFENRPSAGTIEEVVDALTEWLERSAFVTRSGWPYSMVTNHWPGMWTGAKWQPRCDVNVRYQPVRICGGGCSLEVQLCPAVLFANASPVELTLRAEDDSPLCKMDPGIAVAPPSVVLHRPFFLSTDSNRDTCVSTRLQVCQEEPGRYGQPPPGHIALDRPAEFAIRCKNEVALLTICYEIKQEINVLGVTSTYFLINRLPFSLSVSTQAIVRDDVEYPVVPTKFQVFEPVEDRSIEGKPLCLFNIIQSTWGGGDVSELRLYVFIAHSNRMYSVPVLLEQRPMRRAITLRVKEQDLSIPVVVTVVRHECRWLVTVAADPCPQLLVHNRTSLKLGVAQSGKEDTSLEHVPPVPDCRGIRFWYEIQPGGVMHYSTPAHSERYPPTEQKLRPPVPFLTIGRDFNDDRHKGPDFPTPATLSWSRGVAIAEGEHLLQLSGGRTIKVRVRTYPHSTYVGLLDVEQSDLSAKDIRQRLLSALPGQPATPPEQVEQNTSVPSTSNGEPKKESNTDLCIDIESKQDSTPNRLLEDQQNDVTTNNSKELSDEEIGDLEQSPPWWKVKEVGCTIDSIAVTFGAAGDTLPLLEIYLQRAGVLVKTNSRTIQTTITVDKVQVDNAEHETEMYDFAVVAKTQVEIEEPGRWQTLWGMWHEQFSINSEEATVSVQLGIEKWEVYAQRFQELTEIEVRMGQMGLYIEDTFVAALARLLQLAMPSSNVTADAAIISESKALAHPVRLRKLYIHPLNITLTLHTAIRMYIALDQSPLRLSAFQLQDAMTSQSQLIHMLTVHYLSAAILGAGWVVGGLELLGAPGALAARVGNAGGGVRGVASATAGALLRSLSAAAGSLARNLDLLAGDDDHARRAAQARRRPPASFMAGIATGMTNFAINLLGAVGGLAHHPLVGVAVGESNSGAVGLRRGLLGAITKPLSATADLVAFAGHGLLTQTGWDPEPKPRLSGARPSSFVSNRWRRDCVRWTFRLAELTAFAGFHALLNHAEVYLLITDKYMVVVDPKSERILEMIDFKTCTLKPYEGPIVEVLVAKKSKSESRLNTTQDEDNDYQLNPTALARVARFTGAEAYIASDVHTLSLFPTAGQSHALYAALAVAVQHNNVSHFQLL